jgi:hypothetical protein
MPLALMFVATLVNLFVGVAVVAFRATIIARPSAPVGTQIKSFETFETFESFKKG